MKKALMSIGSLLTSLVRDSAGGSSPPNRASIPGTASSRDAVIVLDASPSMKYCDWKPSRLAGAKEATKAFVRRLFEADPDARVAIVAYSARAHVVVQLQSVRNSPDIIRRIDRIKTGSATNITAGLETATKILRQSHFDQQVILLTDGQHNSGPRPETIASHLRQFAVVECIGMAGSPDTVDRRLPDLASTDEMGRQRYRWIGEPEQLVRTFEQLATGLTRE